MKKLSILIFIAISTLQGVSQQKLLLTNETKTLKANLIEYINSKQNEKITFGNYYKLVQFKSIPNQEQKNEMIALGMEFLEYLPKNAYIISFPKNFNKQNLINKNIWAVMDLWDNIRMSSRVEERPLPSWTMDEGNVKLYLSFYQNIDFEKALNKLQESNYTILENHPHTNRVLISTSPDNIYELLNGQYIRFIDLMPQPGEPEDDLARHMHRSSLINTLYSTGRKYDGTGVALCVNDDGFAGPHIDFQGRTEQSTVASDLVGTHGDMVAGIVGGAGNLNPINAGMAKGSFIHVRQYNSSLPNTVTLHQNDSVVAFNSSYSNGCNAGYTSLTQQVDQEIRQNPSLIQVFSAGNSNGSDCGYGAGNQWGNITGGHKMGKNVLTCANLDRDESLRSTSSRGPANDGRIKPDISSQGNNQVSTDPNNSYAPGGGTSAAAPGITGIVGQLYQAYRDLNGVNPESSLIKACLINTAEDFGNVGPDFKFGWGRVNALRALQLLEDGRYFDDTLVQGVTNTHTINIPTNVKEAKIMVYWMDYEGSTVATTALVNDLNIQVTQGGSTYMPWILDPTPNAINLNTPATTGVDSLNNVEQVSITNPVSGSYTLSVNGYSVPQGPQKYWVVYEFLMDDITLVNPAGGDGYEPGETVRVFWDAYTDTGNFTFDYSTNGGTSWTTVSSTIPGSDRWYDWTVPSIASGNVLARISRGPNADTCDHPFTILSTPTNVTVTQVCPTYLEVSWTAVTGANEYEVYLLGSAYMDSVGRTSSTSFQIPITDPNASQWVSVAGIVTNANDNVGRRANAINYPGGLLNCTQPTDAGISSISFPSSICGASNLSVTVSIKNYGTNTISNVPVNYQVNGGTVVSETYGGSINSGATANYTFTNTSPLGSTGAYTINAWTSLTGDGYVNNDSSSIIYNYSATVTAPTSETFDALTNCSNNTDCGATLCPLASDWLNLENGTEDDIDWRVFSGGTTSSGTGPTMDHSGSGKYIYLEASNNCYGQEAILESSCIDLSSVGAPYLFFWYHMYGADMGSLSVDIFDGTTWVNDVFTKTGNQANTWFEGKVSLIPYGSSTIKIRFRGVTGPNWASDMALDDINITSTTGIEAINDNDISIYPNPTQNGSVTVYISELSSVKALKLYTVAGKLIKTIPTSNQRNISLTNLDKGTYLLKSEGNQQSITKKIVVME